MATIAPTAMIFVPSVDGISHAPKELGRWEDCANGAEVLYRTVLAIDQDTVVRQEGDALSAPLFN